MKVWNPISGRWFILHWWTDDDRGHLAFASTEESLRAVAKDVFTKEPHAKCKALLEIEAVAPSDRMSRMAAEHDLREAIQTFCYGVFAQLAEARDAGKALPPMFEPCGKYEPDEDGKDDDWERRNHYSCKKCCLNAIRLVGMTKGDLYAQFHEGWDLVTRPPRRGASKGPKQHERAESNAVKASDGEPLWFAHANFGPHAGGVELHEVDLTEGEEYRPKGLSGDTLFFFRLLRRVEGELLDEVVSASKAAMHAWEEERERSEAANKKERRAEKKQRMDAVLDLFNRGRS